MVDELAYIPGSGSLPGLPMGRFIPPVPAGMLPAWVGQKFSRGALLLDPLGSTPLLPLECARAGYRVVVASNNPILTFMLEVLAGAPPEADFRAALAELGAARRGEERLEVFFRSLYETECAACKKLIQPEAFIWRRGEAQPYARIYRCPFCGDEGERSVGSADLERLAKAGNPALHRARALERIAPPGDAQRETAEEILNAFVPRALYFLTTLINRIEGLGTSGQRRKLLTALALSVCDGANNLWGYPENRSRPRQLSVPPVFRENNLWLALDQAASVWAQPGKPVPVSRWPELPPGYGGICLYPGRLKGLTPFPSEFAPQAVLAVLPRPNQAFWTLSAVWSGWIWGREAVGPLRTVLDRQRYDWHWHAQALHNHFNLLAHELQPETPLWAAVPEVVPGFLSAVILAGEAGGLRLEGMALQPEAEFAQLAFKPAPRQAHSVVSSIKTIEPVIQEAVEAELARLNQPTQYLGLHAAGLARLVEKQGVPQDREAVPGEWLTQLQNSFGKVFKPYGHLRRYERQPSQNIETGWWWLGGQLPLSEELPRADRIEMELVRWLLKNPGKTAAELYAAVCQAFPGVHAPSMELVQVCLQSYAGNSSDAGGGWQIPAAEQPAVRRTDLETIRRGLGQLGKKMGFATGGDSPLVWKNPEGRPEYLFYPIVSGLISKYVLASQVLPPQRCVLVIPGSRVNLILYKLNSDPRLAEAVEGGWRFLKFRQLRRMLDHPRLTPELFLSLLTADPPSWDEATQLPML